MAEKNKDRLADALAALAGGDHQEPEDHGDDIHGHVHAEPAEELVVSPPPPAPVARPVQASRPPAIKKPTPRPVAPPPPARVRPAAPVLPIPPADPADVTPPSPRRPDTPNLGIAPQAPSEAASPSEFLPADIPAAEPAEDPGDEAQDPFASSEDEYADQPDPQQSADDEVYAPAPELADFMTQRFDPMLRGLGFKRSLIPTLLVLGGLFLFMPLFGWAFTAEESGFRMLPTWLPVLLILFGLALLAAAGVMMSQVSFLLKRQAELGLQ